MAGQAIPTYSIDQAIPTYSIDPSVTSALAAIYPSATAQNGHVAELMQFNNMSTRAFDEAAYSLNHSQTGCYRRGALPVALADNDTCLLGWHCMCAQPNEVWMYGANADGARRPELEL